MAGEYLADLVPGQKRRAGNEQKDSVKAVAVVIASPS